MNDFPDRMMIHLQSRLLCVILLGALMLHFQGCAEQVETPEDQFSRHVRTTPAVSPEEERTRLRVPAGFEVQLFASDPDIGKPMNMAFDDRGRLWVTQSYEYPFADTTGAGRDRISILEDTDGDGRADKVEVFADSLNIPIGIVTMPEGVIAYSIPNLYYLRDLDGDDRVDEREVLYSGFRYDDTHGMINNLIRGWDGWIHAGHGFSNTSTVAGTDGDTIVMFSGNTFRFRADGSRVEFTTTGRVNPFGYTYDEWGYTYSVDCHTSPVYQLIRGADYPHFGKQPTGIGFGPALMDHHYGATALAGLELYVGHQYPATYQHNFYYGDVVKCRVYRASMTMQGTTPVVTQEEDFVISDDPWFRPVDVKLGPDGALYIADFYNSIIGHYEVPLDHPARDRRRGRIWRIVYTGDNATAQEKPSGADGNLTALVEGLKDPQLSRRMATADLIVDHFEPSDADPLRSVLARSGHTRQQVQLLWILHRLKLLTNTDLHPYLSANDTLQVHALRILFERELAQSDVVAVDGLLNDPSPHVQRQAVMVLARYPSVDRVERLLSLFNQVPEEDTHLQYTIRQAVRDQLRDASVLQTVVAKPWEDNVADVLAGIMPGVNHPEAARFLSQYLQGRDWMHHDLSRLVRHIATTGDSKQINTTIRSLRASGQVANSGYALYQDIEEGLTVSGREMPEAGKAWGLELASSFLQLPPAPAEGWYVQPLLHHHYNGNTWQLIDSLSMDSVGGGYIRALASGPKDWNGSGISSLTSSRFTMPDQLQFVLIGRKRPPGEDQVPEPPVNSVQLRMADTDEVVLEAFVTEEEHREELIWSRPDLSGKQVYLRVVDGAERWAEFIGVGAFEPQMLRLPEIAPMELSEKLQFAARTAASFEAKALVPGLMAILTAQHADLEARIAVGEAVLSLAPDRSLPVIEEILADSSTNSHLSEGLLQALTAGRAQNGYELLTSYLPDATYAVQRKILLDLCENPANIDWALQWVQEAVLPPRLLLERQIHEILDAGMQASQRDLYRSLTAGIKPPSAEIQQLIDKRLADFNPALHDVNHGMQVQVTYCSACHTIDGVGGNIGPQLDGIGNWGERALTEKILDPNRNISRAFVQHTVTLQDGTIRTGLFRREEGEVLVFADATGAEYTLAKDQIAEQKVSPYTLMPDHFGTVIPEDDFNDLLTYLLSEK